jgi:hypothetical protein
MDAYMTGQVNHRERNAHTVLDIDGWILWDWDDRAPSAGNWHLPYAMFHRCGQETSNAAGHNGVKKTGDGIYECSRCALNPPVGLVCSYELMNWEAKGYGG